MTEQMRVEPEFPVPDDVSTRIDLPRKKIEVVYTVGTGVITDTFYTNSSLEEDKDSVWWKDVYLVRHTGWIEKQLSTHVYSKLQVCKYVVRLSNEVDGRVWDRQA